MGRLQVRLIKAQSLALASDYGYTEPYCTFQVGITKHTISTQPATSKKQKSKDPQFNKTFMFDIANPYSDKLHVHFYDKDEAGTEYPIGETTISLTHVKKNQEVRQWYRLVKCLSGDVEIAITADFDVPPPAAASPSVQQPVYQAAPHVPGVAAAGIPQGYPPTYAANPMPALPYGVPASGWPPAAAPPVYAAPQPVAMQGWGQPQPQMVQRHVTPNIQQVKPRERVNEQDLLKTLGGGPEPTPQRWQPRQLNPQDIHRDFPHIAKGSFGVVFTGTLRGYPHKVVVKDMEVHNQKNIEDWKKEIQMMARNACPYVVEIFGHCASGHILTIVMEYMKKGSLYDVLHQRKEPLSLLQRFRMGRQCALAVAHLHSAGVIHRDIKSMNILVSDDLCCKLTDFGCAKLINDRSVMNTANSGTPLWMAPEVKAGIYDFSADVYSLGLVLYELFENALPAFDTARQTVVLPKDFRSASVVLTCIAARPASRPTAAQVVKVLDKMIRNIVNKVKKLLPPEEEQLLRLAISPNRGQSSEQFSDDPDLDDDLKQLYTHLLATNAKDVDALITKAFAQADQPSPKLSSSAPPGGYAPPPVQPAPQQYNHYPTAPQVQPQAISTPPVPSYGQQPLVNVNTPPANHRAAPTAQYPPSSYAYNPTPSYSAPSSAPGREAASPNNYSSNSANSSVPDLLGGPAVKPSTMSVDLLGYSGIVPRASPTNSNVAPASVNIAPSVLSVPTSHTVGHLLDLDLPSSAPTTRSASPQPPQAYHSLHPVSSPPTGSLVDIPEAAPPPRPMMGALLDLPLPQTHITPPAVMASPVGAHITPPKTPSPTLAGALVDLSEDNLDHLRSPYYSNSSPVMPPVNSSGHIYPDI